MSAAGAMNGGNGANGADGSRFGLSDTRVLSDLAIERGYVTREQVEECLGIREKIRAMGLEEKLPDIMVKKGYLSAENAGRLEKALSGHRKLGNFEIVARIGQGSMGAVFKARQVSMDRFVAVKILPPRLAKDPTYVERFLREARVVAKLNHINIVQGIDVGEAGGYYYFAMEYVEGVTVRETLKTKGPYGEKAALEIVAQIAKALDHAAKAGLVHRDIKPDNVIVTPAGVAKLLDLGIAKTADAVDESGQRVGTPYYISPEQARGDANVDARSDIYSLGATLYHMVVGSPPFTGAGPEEIIRAHLTSTVPNPREVRPGLSRSISRLIEMMMARDPADRYQSAAELLGDVEKVSRGLPPAKAKTFKGASSVELSHETGETGRTAVTGPLQPVGSRRQVVILLISVVAVVIILAIGVAAFLAISNKPPPAQLPPVQVEPQPIPEPEPGPSPSPLPTPEPSPDAKSAAAREMLDYALKKVAENPASYEDNIKLFEDVVAETKGTAAGLEAGEELEKLRKEFGEVIQKSLDSALASADAKAREHRFAEAISALDAGFPGRYRHVPPDWGNRYRKAVKGLEDRSAAWVSAEEKRAADLVAKHEFDKAREVVRGIAVAGTPAINARVSGGLAGIDKVEADFKKQLADQQQRQQEESLRQREVAYAKFLRALYGKEAAGGFDAASRFCQIAPDKAEYSAAKDDIRLESKDLAEMRKADADILSCLGAMKGTIRFTWNRQPMAARVLEVKDDRVWVSPGMGAEFPITPGEMIASEVVDVTGFGKGSPANAARAAFYLTWRGDFPSARAYAAEMAEGAQRDRALRRLDLLEKGLAEFDADELIRKARAAYAAGNADEFGRLMAALRSKYGATKAFASARPELENLELEATLSGLDPATLFLGNAAAAGGALTVGYDFKVDSPQVLDWQSTGDMWRWSQPIYDRTGIDVFVQDAGRLIVNSGPDKSLGAVWAVPVGKFSSIQFDVTPLGGRGSIGLGLTKGDLFQKDNTLRAWFPESGKPYVRQGDQRKQAAADIQIERGRKYRVRLEVAGKEVRLFLDGKELVRDALTFDPAGSRLVLGVWSTVAAFGPVQIACQPEDSWLKRRAELAAKFKQAGVKPGLSVDYFADTVMKKKAASRVERSTVLWWSERSPAPGVPADGFSARADGKLYVEKAGKYRLYMRADDDGALWIDGKLVLEAHTGNNETDATLSAGFHELRMTIADGGGHAGIELSWQGPGIARQPIPCELLGH